jgi:hypothetical protein
MTTWGWAAVALLVVALVWLGLALAGAVRELAALKRRVELLEEGTPVVHLAEGLPVGTRAPSWEIEGRDRRVFPSSQLRGTRHVVIFADAECRACDQLIPAVIGEAPSLPRVVVVGRGEPASTPAGWTSSKRVSVGVEHGDDVSTAFRTEVSPHVFVLDEAGFIAAQGTAATVEEIRGLLRDADQIQIVATGDGGA